MDVAISGALRVSAGATGVRSMNMDPWDDAGGVFSLVQRGFHSKPRCLLVNARFERDVALHPSTRSQKPRDGKSGT